MTGVSGTIWDKGKDTHLRDPLLDVLAFRCDNLDVDVIVSLVNWLGIAFLVLAPQHKANSQQDSRADDVAYSNDDPRDMVPTCRSARISVGRKSGVCSPRLVFRLPHERRGRVADTVRDKHDRIRRDTLGMSRCDAGEPRQREDESRRANTCNHQMPHQNQDMRKRKAQPKVSVEDAPVVHCANRSPILLDHGRRLIKNTPMMLGMKYTAPTMAREFGMRDTSCTPVKMVAISIKPSTQPSSVV